MFFLNPFSEEFRGNLVLADRALSLTFVCPPNAGRGQEMVLSWADGPYDLTGNDDDGVDKSNLTIYYAYDPEFKAYSSLSIDVEAGSVSSSAVTVREIVTALNADTTFAELFEAALNSGNRIYIRQKRDSTRFRFYISLNGAETAIKFNGRAGVAELPTYFDRHIIANRYTYDDSVGMLLPLNHVITGNTVANPTVVTSAGHSLSASQQIIITGSNSSPTIDGTRVISSPLTNTFTVPVNVTTAGTRARYSTLVEAAMIDGAVDAKGKSLGYSSSTVQDDWDLLRGRSGLFTFQKLTVDGSDRITQIIEYHAGSEAGDFSRKILYTYTGANTKPSTISEIPYVLQSGDLITPP